MCYFYLLYNKAVQFYSCLFVSYLLWYKMVRRFTFHFHILVCTELFIQNSMYKKMFKQTLYQGFGSGSARIRMFLPCPDPDPHKFADPDPGKKVRK